MFVHRNRHCLANLLAMHGQDGAYLSSCTAGDTQCGARVNKLQFVAWLGIPLTANKRSHALHQLVANAFPSQLLHPGFVGLAVGQLVGLS